MFTYIYQWVFYRFLKSGMLLDFFFKKIIFYKLYFLYIISNIYFSEKYFIEYNFLIINKYILVFKNFINYFSTQFIIRGLSIILVILVFLLIILYI